MIWHWYLIDMTHPGARGAIGRLRGAFGKVCPGNRLSVTKRLDGAEALVKAPAGVDLDRPPLVKFFRSAPVKLLRSPAWQPEADV